MYDYQMEAVQKMKNGCILCGGVGSGKSRTALAYYYISEGGELGTENYIPMGDPPRDLYIITTARKRDDKEWEQEMAPFLLSTHSENNLYCNKVIVDSWNKIQSYVNVENAFFIFDEQRVIGSGKWVKAFLAITRRNRWVLLSATPGDTWKDYIPVFIANGFYKNRSEFTREHIVYSPMTSFPKIDHYVNTGKLIRYRNSILVNMNYQHSAELHHEDIYCGYDISKYKEAAKSRWDPFKDEPITNAANLCFVWRKIVNTDESRQKALFELLELHPKAIIFYNFNYELELLKDLLNGITIAEWNGQKHQLVPSGSKWAYLVQYNAGSEGWNCIETDTIIFYSQNYSYRTMLQAAGRIDRLNTPYKDLYYFHLKSHSGIDAAITKALRSKKDFNESKFVKW